MDEIIATEHKLGHPLPSSFQDSLLHFAKGLDFQGKFPEDIGFPKPLREIFCSALCYSLDAIVEMNQEKEKWVHDVFPDRNNEYDKVWHNKLAFMSVPNGDYIAFDLEDEKEDKRVVYLSHDDGVGHGYVLGNGFGDFVNRYIRICCCGSEEWQITPFMPNATDGILPDSENAVLLRKALGIEFHD